MNPREAHLRRCWERHLDIVPQLRDWTLAFSKRCKTTAGLCYFDLRIIRLARAFVDDPRHPIEALEDILLHEIAHVIAGREAGHGLAWREAALALGCSAKRCHSMKPSTPAKHRFGCACPGRVYSRHLLRGPWRHADERLVCQHCRGPLHKLPADHRDGHSVDCK